MPSTSGAAKKTERSVNCERWEPKAAWGRFFHEKKSAWLVGLIAFWLLCWGILIPSFGSIKDSSIKVQEGIARHAELGPVLIGQSEATPPSLPFYLEKKHPLSFTIQNGLHEALATKKPSRNFGTQSGTISKTETRKQGQSTRKGCFA
jgi:hypothetical protein